MSSFRIKTSEFNTSDLRDLAGSLSQAFSSICSSGAVINQLNINHLRLTSGATTGYVLTCLDNIGNEGWRFINTSPTGGSSGSRVIVNPTVEQINNILITPIPILPGVTGSYYVIDSWEIYFGTGGTAYTDTSGSQLALNYSDGSSAAIPSSSDPLTVLGTITTCRESDNGGVANVPLATAANSSITLGPWVQSVSSWTGGAGSTTIIVVYYHMWPNSGPV
jgi:hypothetical protein